MKLTIAIVFCCLSAFSQIGMNTPRIGGNSLIGWWTLNDASGTNMVDLSGRGNDAKSTNAIPPVWTNGVSGTALSFNSTNFAYMPIPLARTTGMTISAWAYLKDLNQSNIIFHYGGVFSPATPNGTGWGIGVGSNNADTAGNRFVALVDEVGWIDFKTNIGVGWHFLALTRDTSTWRGYIDGVKSSVTSTINPRTPATSSGIAIDCVNGGAYKRIFGGMVDDCRVYSTNLSDQDIMSLYNGGRGTQK